MKIKTIGFGATKNTGNYNSLKVYFEAELESDEFIDTYMDALRALVAAELDLGDEFFTVRAQIRNKKLELANLVAAIDAAKIQLEDFTNKWHNLLEYFGASHPDIGTLLTGVAIVKPINFDEIDDGCDEEVDPCSDISCSDFSLFDEEDYNHNF